MKKQIGPARKTTRLMRISALAMLTCSAVCLSAVLWPSGNSADTSVATHPSAAQADDSAAKRLPADAAKNAKPISAASVATFPQWSSIQLCQSLSHCPHGQRGGVDCDVCSQCKVDPWYPVYGDLYGPGEYTGHARTQHVPEYRVRTGDELSFIYRRTRITSYAPYKLNVGDTIRVESMTEEKLDRNVIIDPNGNIMLPPATKIGQVRAAGRTIKELTEELEKRYKKLYPIPAITVTPIKIETRLQDLVESVDARFGEGGLAQRSQVTPEGTIQLPGIGNVPVNGLTLGELKKEIEARYAEVVLGIGVDPRLVTKAPNFVYVAGEVRRPGRIELTGPTTVMQAIAEAGSFNVGADLRKIVIFRRTENWGLIATTLDLQEALLGKDGCPANEIWLRDSDIVLLPKTHLLLTSNFLELIFSRGIYQIIPLQGIVNIDGGSLL